MLEEQAKSRFVRFREKITGTKATTHENCIGLGHDEDVFCTAENKDEERTAPRLILGL
jgi:hypothetical protein